MLSTETIEIIKSTVPLLEEHGQAITSHFYETLFEENPALKNVFNQTNQKRGDQPRALADAVLAYAKNIDNLEALLPAVERIAHKHASIGVLENQYPIVGKNLLRAIQKVLGLPDNHPALVAWEEAYNILASIFIGAEKAIYKANEEIEGGWSGLRDFVVDRVVEETIEVKSFYLKPSDGGSIPKYKGGQFIGIKVNPVASEFDAIRQYSLSGDQSKGFLRITIKNETEGLVSGHLHGMVEGDSVQLRAPTGVFVSNDKAKKQVFVAGGVGITPLIAMIYDRLRLGASPQDIVLIQCSRDETLQILKNEILALEEGSGITVKRCFDVGDDGDHQGYLTESILRQWLTESSFAIDGSTDLYFCGPKPFMKSLYQHANTLGFDEANVHYEVFGPTNSL